MKTIPKEIKANMFIMECKMLPMAGLGMTTNELHVYNVQDRLLGYYEPNTKMFRRLDSYGKEFSTSLINKIMEF